jgi:hypothetical protein
VLVERIEPFSPQGASGPRPRPVSPGEHPRSIAGRGGL